MSQRSNPPTEVVMAVTLIPQKTERRSRNRIQDSFSVDIFSDHLATTAQTLNISEEGLSLLASKNFQPSSRLHLSLRLGQSPTRPTRFASARIVWSEAVKREEFVYGLNFLEIDDQDRLVLQEKIARREKIIVASYLPETTVRNEDIIKAAGLDTNPVAIQRSLGAIERRAADPNTTAAAMMAKVADRILRKAALSPLDLDRIICLTNPGDSAEPDTSIAVQEMIGAKCPAFGISMSCTGWIMAVDVALRYLATGEKRILVMAASTMGSRPYFHNLMHRAIFGDGAGGMLVESHHQKNILSIAEIADGKYYSKIFLPYPWSQKPIDIPDKYRGSFYMSSDQEAFFSAMDHYLPTFTDRLLEKAGVTFRDIDLYLLHYPSKPLFEHSVKVLNLPRRKILSNYQRYGNLVAAEIPILMEEALESGLAKSGNLLFILTYGAGFTMGGMIIRVP